MRGVRDEELLRRNHDLLERLFRNSPAAVALVRLDDGVVLDVNEAYERLFGWRREEAIGRSSEALRVWVNAGDRARFREQLESGGRVTDFESPARRRNGEVFDSLLSSEIIEASGERIALVIVNDVSVRKRAEDARALLGAVVGNSSDAIIVSDPAMRIVSWSAGAERMFGWSAAEAVGRELSLIVPRERWQETTGNTERMRRGEGAPTFETVRLAKDGRPLDVQVSISGVYEGGHLKLVAGIFRDITERKRAEEELRQSEQRFRALVELSSDWYWVTDAEHRFTFREGEILRRMGIPPEADYGQRRWEMGFVNLSEEDWAAHRALLERREEFRDLLLERRSPDGRVHWATISGRPLYDAQGRFAGYHGTGRDVTSQILAEQRLHRFNVELENKVVQRTEALHAANRELEAFSYTVSHDLRAPLRAIDGFAELIEEQCAAVLDAQSREHLEHLRRAVVRMNRLIDDLLDFSQAGRAELSTRPVDLSELARAIAGEIASSDPRRRVAWRIAEGLHAHADPALMRVVLENLLSNAWKYTGQAAEARIEMGRADSGEFFVRDNGIGFDPAQRDAVFEPFRRLQGAQAFEGTGVGLATVARIIARHGGRVRADGAPGEGAVFHFFLPPGGEAAAG